MNTRPVWGGRGPALWAMRAGLDVKDGWIQPLLQMEGRHCSSAGQNRRLLTNHSITPWGFGKERLDICAHLNSTPKPHPCPQTWYSQSNIKNTPEAVHYSTKTCEGRWEKRGVVSEQLKGGAGVQRTVRLRLLVADVMGRGLGVGSWKSKRGKMDVKVPISEPGRERKKAKLLLRKLLQFLKS